MYLGCNYYYPLQLFLYQVFTQDYLKISMITLYCTLTNLTNLQKISKMNDKNPSQQNISRHVRGYYYLTQNISRISFEATTIIKSFKYSKPNSIQS